jgi:hypothetical protein
VDVSEPLPVTVSRDEFYEFIETAMPDVTLAPWQERILDSVYEWDAPAEGDVLPNGMRVRYHARIDASAGRALNIGRH